MGVPLYQVQRQFILERAKLTERWSYPVLVWVGAAPTTVADGSDAWQPTQAGHGLSRPGTGDALVLPVEKRNGKGNAFAMGITVGRGPTNDVVLEDGSISRFHAYFQHDARKGVWTLTDADSNNGTRVGEQTIVPRQVVEDGARVRFGDVATRFLLPARFFAWLEAGADPAKL